MDDANNNIKNNNRISNIIPVNEKKIILKIQSLFMSIRKQIHKCKEHQDFFFKIISFESYFAKNRLDFVCTLPDFFKDQNKKSTF